jgi:hypothetical protein
MPAQALAANAAHLVGYNTVRGDFGTRPTIKADGVITSFTLVTTGAGNHVENVILDGNSRTTSRGMTGSNATAYKVTAKNCTNSGLAGGGAYVLCEATACATASPAFAATIATWCTSHANTVTGFGFGGTYIGCIADSNSGASSRGFDDGFTGLTTCMNCIAYNNGSDGFRWNNTAGSGHNFNANDIAYLNGGYGFNNVGADDGWLLYNCAGASNTSGNFNSFTSPSQNVIGFVSLSGDPFTNAAGGDFSLNNTAGRGAACRAAGIAGAFLGESTTSYLDIGAVQHQDTGGTSGPVGQCCC